MPALASSQPVTEETAGGATLVVGAGGFLGSEVVRALAAGGHRVVGLVRDGTKAARVTAAGGTAAVGDVLDQPSLVRAAQGCTNFVHLASAWNDSSAPEARALEVRVEGARNLARAAGEVGGRRLVVGSGYWIYPDTPGPIDETTPAAPEGESRANHDAETAATEAAREAHAEVLVVRPGMVYGDGAWFRPMAEAIREGSYRVVEGGTNHWSFVALSDTGAAFRAVLESGRAGEVYNVVDGMPATWRDFVRTVAAELGRPPPPSIDRRTAEELYGPIVARHLLANRYLLPERLRALGWRPRFPSYREGIPPLLREMAWP